MIQKILYSLILSTLVFTSKAQEVDYQKFLGDCQRSTSESGELKMTWYIPIEFWEFTFQKEESLTEKEKEEFINLLKPYVIFAVVEGEMGTFGSVTYTSYESLFKSMVLLDKDNKSHKPIDHDDLNGDIQTILAVFKPILKNMMGQLGENMNFYVFDDVNGKNERIIDPYEDGSFKLSYKKTSNEWITPLPSLLPEKVCPTDNILHDGSWLYCPWHGVKLIPQ